MANAWAIVLAIFVLIAPSVGGTNVQQHRLRRTTNDENDRELEFVANTLQGSKTVSVEPYLEYGDTVPKGSNTRKGIGRTNLLTKVAKSAKKLKKVNKKAKVGNKLNELIDKVRDQIKDEGILPAVPAVPSPRPTKAPVGSAPSASLSLAPPPLKSNAPSLSASSASSVDPVTNSPSAQPISSPSTQPSLTLSIIELDEAILGDSDGEDISNNEHIDENDTDETMTSDRDRFGSPTWGIYTETGSSDIVDSATESSAANVTTGRFDNESSREDQKIGEPTRDTDRNDLFSITKNSTSDSGNESAATDEITGRFSDEASRESQKIGGPTRSTDRDNVLSEEFGATSSSERNFTSINETSGRMSDESSRDNKRIGTATTNRDNDFINPSETMFASEKDASSASDFTGRTSNEISRGDTLREDKKIGAATTSWGNLSSGNATESTVDSASVSELTSRTSDEENRNDRKIGVATTNRDNQVSNVADTAFLGV